MHLAGIEITHNNFKTKIFTEMKQIFLSEMKGDNQHEDKTCKTAQASN